MSGDATPTIEAPATGRRIAESGLAAAPLGPGSLTWKYFADRRGILLAQRAGVLQAMHPAIAAALLDHSDFFDNPIGRLARSSGPIVGVIYDENPSGTGAWVRDQHPSIKGADEKGRRYHALDPETFFWAHATFFEGMITAQELFGDRPLTRLEKERAYAESVTWYARYGVSMRPVPEDYAAFERYWARMFSQVLEPTRVARGSVRRVRGLPSPPGFPGLLWKPIAPLVGIAGPWLTRVTLPPEAREMFGFEPSDRDRSGLRALQRTVRAIWPLVPGRYRMLAGASVNARSSGP